MFAKERHLYYDQNNIVVEGKSEASELAVKWYSKIISHELGGLASLGCTAERIRDWTVIHNAQQQESTFLNRVVDICCHDQHSVADMYASVGHSTFEINLFSSPDNLEEILVQNGAAHKLSSIVLGKELPDNHPLPKTPFKIVAVTDENLAILTFPIFSTFFLKEGETCDEARQRFLVNISRGPHFVAFDGDIPIGMIGSTIINDVAGMYTGIIDPQYRTGNGLPIRMTIELERTLHAQGVSFVYCKSRNRAVVLGSKMFLGLKHLYNERVYEKK